MLHTDGTWDCSESVLGFWASPSLLVRDARTKEELAHGALNGQNDRLDISVMDAKERPDADVTGLRQAWQGGGH